MALSTTASLVEKLNAEPGLARLIFAILDPQLPDDLIANIRARLEEMIENVPVVAWTYIDDQDDVFLAQARTREEAREIIQEDTGHVIHPGEIGRCEAMDGLGYKSLYALYSNGIDEAQCAEFDTCGTYIAIQESHLVNADTRGGAIVVGDTLYCSRFCADHAG